MGCHQNNLMTKALIYDIITSFTLPTEHPSTDSTYQGFKGVEYGQK